jgi:DNA-binding XRE family transcriptional regulator
MQDQMAKLVELNKETIISCESMVLVEHKRHLDLP